MELPSPPDLFAALSSFRTRRLFCDVCLRFPDPDRPRFFAHGVVLAAASPFFAEACGAERIVTGAGVNGAERTANVAERTVNSAGDPSTASFPAKDNCKTVYLPSSIDDETISLLLCWMYNEAPKVEWPWNYNNDNNSFNDDNNHNNHNNGAVETLWRNLQHAAQQLDIHALSEYFRVVNADRRMNGDDQGYDLYDESQERSMTGDFEDRTMGQNKTTVDRYDGCLDDEDNEDVKFGEHTSKSKRQLRVSLTRLTNGDDDALESVIKTEIDLDAEGKELRPENADEENVKKRVRRKRAGAKQKLVAKRRRLKADAENDGNLFITCEKCGKNVRQSRLTHHNRFFHELKDVGLPKAEEKKVLLERNDPVLRPMVIDGVFTCVTCDFSLKKWEQKRKSLFWRHCAKHLRDQHQTVCPNVCFPCPACGVVCYGRDAAVKHRERQHENPEKKSPCPECGKVMLDSTLKKHIKQYHDENNEGTPCPVCGKRFVNPKYLPMHMRVHEETKEFHCQWCHEMHTNDKNMFRHHVYRRHGVLMPPDAEIHRCPECDYTSTVVHMVNLHRKNRHAVEESFICKEPLCTKAFKTQRLLTNHVERIHLRKQRARCVECDIEFQSKSGMEYHMWRVHNTGRHGGLAASVESHIKQPFKCAYCHHTSGLSGNIRKHLRGVHAGLPIKFVDLRKIAIDSPVSLSS